VSAAGSEPDDDEAVAIGALRQGDHQVALEVLMRAYGREVYRYCGMMVGDRERAKDVLQKTFVQTHASFGRFRGQSSLRTWLYSIARHRCLDEARAWRRWGRRATDLEGVSDVLPDSGGGPERRVMDEERRRLLAGCLGKLAPRVRDAVVQRFIEGLSYQEMSAVTRERAGTLRVRIARAMPVLRHCLEASGLAP
jgi:RNA polymerase sigma-70 factor, ECF subfamily